MRGIRVQYIVAFFALLASGWFLFSGQAHAQDEGFSVQVTPSPLVATIKPGVSTTLELKIQNTGSKTEEYITQLRAFSVDSQSGSIDLSNDEPKDIRSFVRFEAPQFTLEPGEWFNQRIYIDAPDDSGFSYSFAILIQRSKTPNTQNSGAALEGSVAVFTLLNIDRPGATRSLEVVEFSSKKRVYEYLPSELALTIQNTGNSIVAPGGNVFIGRGENDAQPIGVLKVNDQGGYVIPGSQREYTIVWTDGFPAYQNTNSVTKLEWDFSKLSQFRIGKYTAKAIVLFDNGERDVPVEAVVTFWVIPWKILIGMVIVVLLLVVGSGTVLKKSTAFLRKKSPTEP